MATPTKRCGQYAKARCKIGWNNCCGSHWQREWRKYSALQPRFSPPLVQMIRVGARRLPPSAREGEKKTAPLRGGRVRPAGAQNKRVGAAAPQADQRT